MKITAWHIGIVWEDGTEEFLADIPDGLETGEEKF